MFEILWNFLSICVDISCGFWMLVVDKNLLCVEVYVMKENIGRIVIYICGVFILCILWIGL